MQHQKLARLEAKLKQMTEKESTDQIIKVAGLCKDIEFIRREVTDIKEKLDSHYVTQDEFRPVKSLVYGIVSLVLTAVVGAIIALVIKQ